MELGEKDKLFGSDLDPLNENRSYLNRRNDLSFTFTGDQIEGKVTLLGLKSAVVLIGSTIQGHIRFNHIEGHTSDVYVVLSEHYGNRGHEHSIFTSSQHLPVSDIHRSMHSDGVSGALDFSITVPENAVPTLARSSQYLKNGSETPRDAVHIKGYISIATKSKTGDALRFLGWLPLSYISNHLPPHLALLDTTEWENTIGGVLYKLKLVSGRPHIGSTMQFELSRSNGPLHANAVGRVQLCERLLHCLDEPTEPTLDRYLIQYLDYEAKPRYESLAWISHQTNLKETDSGQHLTPHAVSVTSLNDASSVRVVMMDHATHDAHGIEMLEENKGAVRFLMSIPQQAIFQSTFSTKVFFNFWMLVAEIDKQEVHLGPIPVVWSPEIDSDDVSPVNHNDSCALL